MRSNPHSFLYAFLREGIKKGIIPYYRRRISLHPKHEVVVLEMPNPENKDAMDAFQDVMDAMAEETNKEIVQVMEENNCSSICAMDIVYLRSRSRWSEENEKELIRLHSIGQAPNICNWP